MKAKALPPVERLWELFSYNPLTGELTRKGYQRPISNKVDYKRTCVNSCLYPTHRLIYAWVHGMDPGSLCVDHINGNKLDNRISNLRLATYQQNTQNRRGCKHYHYRPERDSWVVRFRVGDKLKIFGSYQTEEEASIMAKQIKSELHGKFAPKEEY